MCLGVSVNDALAARHAGPAEFSVGAGGPEKKTESVRRAMDVLLDDVEARVLGSLMEKSLSTPEYYPLSLNALVAACNQKSSRDPVVDFSQETVHSAVLTLIDKGLVSESTVSRVPKFEECLSRDRKFVPRETAVLCLLMLRGSQTAGEIRARAGRLHAFENLEDVHSTLEDLASWGLIRQLERLPGRKEPRFAHTLSGERQDDSNRPGSVDGDAGPSMTERMASLEAQVVALRDEVEALKQALTSFRSQFE